MSQTTVRKEIANGILSAISSEANKKIRRQVQRGRPQVIRLQNLDFINKTIEELIAGGKESKNVKTVDFTADDIQKARDLAAPYQARFLESRKSEIQTIKDIEDTNEFKRLEAVRPDVAAEISAGTSFLVVSFGVLGTLKRSIVDTLLAKKSKELRSRIKRKIDRGHGTGGGDAVSSIQIAEAAGIAAENDINLSKTKGLSKYLENAFDSVEYIDNPKEMAKVVKDVMVDYQTLISNGKLRAEYIPVITFQDYFGNRAGDAKVEKFVISTVRKFFEEEVGPNDFVNMKGSKSIKDNIETTIVNNLVGKKKTKGTKVTRRLDSKVDTKKKKAKGKTQTSKPARTKDTKAKAAGFAAQKGTRKKTKDSSINLRQLMGILNQRLPGTVAKNMGSPALNFRTGRFASSVFVTDVTRTPQGFASIGYSYMKSPYQTFEPGFAQGSPERDPRKLIDKSIREIAIQLVETRLYTRRV